MVRKGRNHKLDHEMRLKGWGQEDLAQEVGVEPKTVARWINEGATPQPLSQRRLCEVFQKNTEELGLIEVIETSNIITHETVEVPDTQSIPLSAPQGGISSITPAASRHNGIFSQSGKQRVVVWSLLIALVLSGTGVIMFSPRNHLGSLLTPPFLQNPSYSDDMLLFSAATNKKRQLAQWETAPYCSFTPDGFHIIDLYEKGSHTCMAKNLVFTNIYMSVRCLMNHAAYITLHIASIAIPNQTIQGYYISINDNKKYSVQYHATTTPGPNEQIVPWRDAALGTIDPDDKGWITIRVRLQGSELSLWFGESQIVPSFQEKIQHPASRGTIGFSVTTAKNNPKPPVDAAFRDLAIYDLGTT